MAFVPDEVMSGTDEGPVRPLEVARNTRRDPAQAVRLVMWERDAVYLSETQTRLLIAALERALDHPGTLEIHH
jgi:hypothetical protein